MERKVASSKTKETKMRFTETNNKQLRSIVSSFDHQVKSQPRLYQ